MKKFLLLLLVSLLPVVGISASYFQKSGLIQQTTTTATSGGTTVLVATSNQVQIFSGSSNQILELPEASQLYNGWAYDIVNNSTGAVTVTDSDSNTLFTLNNDGEWARIWLTSNVGDTGNWYARIQTDEEYIDVQNLQGLSTDFAPQYLNLARGDSRYFTKAQYISQFTGLGLEPVKTNNSGFIDSTLLDPSVVPQLPIDLTTDVTGVLPIANGGTNSSTANGALNNLLPDQSGHAGEVLSTDGMNTAWQAAGAGDVIGPGSSTDDAIVRWNGTAGTSVQDSPVIIEDDGDASGFKDIIATGTITTNEITSDGGGSGASSERFGLGSTGSGANQTLVGAGITGGTASGFIAIGQNANNSGGNCTDGIAVGRGANVNGGSGCIALGQNSNSNSGGVAIGLNSVGNKDSFVMGAGAAALDNVTGANIVIGAGAEIQGTTSRSLQLGAGGIIPTGLSNYAVFGSETNPYNSFYIGEGITSTTPSTTTLQVSGGSGTDVAGGQFNIYGSRGTGSATPAAMVFGVATADASGTTLQSIVERFRLDRNMQFPNETAVPASPASGYLSFYARGNNFYQLDSAGNETQLGGGGSGTVTSVALSVPGSSIFGVTGSPVTTSGTLGLTTTGTSGGIPYFDSASTLSSSGALTASALLLGGGAGAAPTALGSLGTTTTVLHGNAAGAPTFGAVSLSADVSGTLPVANGGTGQTTYTDGQLLIGNSSGNTLSKATLTAGSNITITNGNGTIEIASTGGGGGGGGGSTIYCTGGNGRGGSSSGEVAVRNFTTCTTNGSDITRTARTTTTGDFFTVNSAGTYTFFYTDARTGGGTSTGFTLNATGGTLDVDPSTPITFANGARCGWTQSQSANVASAIGCTYLLATGDIVRAQTGNATNFTDDTVTFSMSRVD